MGHPSIKPCANNECAAPTRSSKLRAKDAPGTRRRMGKGLCQTCYLLDRATQTLVIEKCRTCPNMTRQKPFRAADAPGTVTRFQDGRCQTCHRTEDRKAAALPDPATVTAVEGFLAARRRRGIPPEGLRWPA